MKDDRRETFSAFMHKLAAEDVDAANISAEDTMGEKEVTVSLPEDDFEDARDIADQFGFKPSGKRGKDKKTDEDRFSFEPRF